MDIKELIAKKKESGASDMDPLYKDAKMGSLKDIHKLASSMLGDDIKGLKKVTVSANDSSGLQAGLEKAKSILGAAEEGGKEMSIGEHANDDEDSEELAEGEDDLDDDSVDAAPGASESGGLSPEEEEMLAHLLSKKLGE